MYICIYTFFYVYMIIRARVVYIVCVCLYVFFETYTYIY